MDDFVLMEKDSRLLRSNIPRIKEFLKNHLGLSLHQRKIHLQHGTKGVPFLGVTIKPGFLLLGNRTKGRLCDCLTRYNHQLSKNSSIVSQPVGVVIRSSVNSYLGLMIHFNTYKHRRKMLEKFVNSFWKRQFRICADFGALILRSNEGFLYCVARRFVAATWRNRVPGLPPIRCGYRIPPNAPFP